MKRTAEEFPLQPGIEAEGFPVGTRVLVDGRDAARVRGYWPRGSTSYLFPHYRLDFEDGDKNVAVAISRVGVKKR